MADKGRAGVVAQDVVVTGAGSGIGRAIAQLAAERGAKRVWILDVNAEGIEETKSLIAETTSTDVRVYRVDIASKADLAGVARAWEEEGYPDLLVNNAGIRDFLGVHETTDESWDRTIAVNLTATFNLIRTFSTAWIERGIRGTVLNIASIAGEVGFSNRAAYCASKAGVVGLTRAAALDLAQYGIRVLAVSPGYVATGISVGSDDQYISESVPIGRRGRAEELASIALDLAGTEIITGANYVVDGGLTAGCNP